MAVDRLTESIDRLHYLHTLMAAAPGFGEAQISEYLGNPGQYLIVRTWSDALAHAAFRQTDAARNFALSRPSGFIYANLAVQEGECVVDTPGPATGKYLVRRVDRLEPAGWDVYVAERTLDDAAALQSGGVDALRTYRLLVKEATYDSQALILQRWVDRDSYVRYMSSSDTSLATSAKTEIAECYQIVDEVMPTSS